jgi:ferredoxin
MARDVFERDAGGKVRVVDGDVAGHLEEYVEAAAEMCPEGSIEVV